jgi:hypothetical protein
MAPSMTSNVCRILIIVLFIAVSPWNNAQGFLGTNFGSGCPVPKLEGQWQHTAANMTWKFLEGGLLICSGDCAYKGGKPIAWHVEQNTQTIVSLDIYLASEKVNTGCSMATRDRIMNLNVFGTFRRIESKP